MNKKQKRILSLLICIAMLITMLPTTAFAADATGVTGVSTKEQLVVAVGTGGTGNVVLESDITDITNQLTVATDTILDLNGHHLSITVTGVNDNCIKIANNAVLTITDSSNPSTGKLEVVADSKKGLNNGAGAGINTTDGTLIIESGTVIAYGKMAASCIGGGMADAAGNIIINGGTVIADYIGDGLAYNGTISTVTIINGGTVKGKYDVSSANSSGEALHKVELTIPGQPNQLVTAASIGGVDCAANPDASQGVYGIGSVSTDENGKLYLYLPASIDGKLITVTLDGTEYGVTYHLPDSGGATEHTMESAVTSISILNEPVKTTYIEGEILELTGLVVRLEKSDGSYEDVDFYDFSSKNIVTTPANGEVLTVSGSAITITHTVFNKSVNLPIIVNPIDATISPTSFSYDLNAPADISTTITCNANRTITDVVCGAFSLPAEAYTVSGSALTIKSSYINGLGVSEGDALPFTVSFDLGNPFTLTVNIVNNYIPSGNALLSSLTVNGNPISGFDPNTTEYHMELPYGTGSVLVGAVPEDPHATVTVIPPLSLPGDATVTVTAENRIDTKSYTIHFTLLRSNNNGFGSYGGSAGTVSNIPSRVTKPPVKPDQPAIGAAKIKAKKGTGKSATAVISMEIIADAMTKALAEAEKRGEAERGIGVLLSISRPAGTDSLSVVLPQAVWTQLTAMEVSLLEIDCGMCSLCLDPEVIKEIQKQSTGDITIHITPVTGLYEEGEDRIHYFLW